MAINKVVYGDTPLIDLTEDTVSPENLMAGETAHDRSGEEIEGTLITNEVKEVPYEEWSEMTPEEQADGSVYFIPNYPVLGGVYFFQSEEAMRAAEAILPDNAICITWEDTPYVVTAYVVEYDNTDSGLDATDVNGAIDEIDGKLSDYPISISPDDGYVSYVKKNGICTVAVSGGITSRTITLPDAFMPCNYLSCSGYYDNTRALLYANNGHPTLEILSNGYDTYMTLSYVATS